MSYIALTRFADLRDKKHIYGAGDEYPRPGYEPSTERIAELAGSENRMGYPLIKAKKSNGETDAVKRTEMTVEAHEDEGKETIRENHETARNGRRGRLRG